MRARKTRCELPYPPVTDQSPPTVGTIARPDTKPRGSTSATPLIRCCATPTTSVIVPLADASAAPKARRGASELQVAGPGLRSRMRTKHTPRACDCARTSANGSLFDSNRSPLTTRTADASNPRALSDVLTFDHSAFVKTWPTGKGELSVALVLAPRGSSRETAPALAINTAPTTTRILVREAPTRSHR